MRLFQIFLPFNIHFFVGPEISSLEKKKNKTLFKLVSKNPKSFVTRRSLKRVISVPSYAKHEF